MTADVFGEAFKAGLAVVVLNIIAGVIVFYTMFRQKKDDKDK